MTVTRTRTTTKTFTRVALIKLQIDIVLTRSRVPKSTIDKILEGIERHWIGEVHLYGLDNSRKAWADLQMKIDWARNQIHVNAGRSEIAVDSRWADDLAVEVDKALQLFSEYCSERELNVIVRLRYASGVDGAHANSVLGFATAANTVQWAGQTYGSGIMRPPEVDEFSVAVNIVVDE